MTEQIQDQISAFVDDELSVEECAFFVRRLERDPDAARQALRFATIGAALRGELVQPDPGILLRRIDAALDGTLAPPAAARRRSARGSALWRPALGVGIAAGVAAVALLMVRTITVPGGEAGAPVAGGPLQATERLESPSYVVPQEPASSPIVPPPVLMTNYLMHHAEYTSRLGRTMVHSNVVVGAEDVIEAAFEEPEPEPVRETVE